MKKIKAGIIGIGRMGQIHLDNMALKFPDVEVIAISDVSESAKSFLDKYQVPKFYADYNHLLADKDIDLLVICSPTDMHAEHIINAVRAGKDVFCEKPIDLTLETAQEVASEIQKSGVKFMLGFNRRFDPNFEKIKSLIIEGKIGDPQLVKITSRDPEAPPIPYIKSSGGLFRDMTIHDFDMACFMTESSVTEVYAIGRNLLDPEIGKAGDVDTAIVTLTFENGVIATIDNSRQAVYGYDQRVEVLGSEGMAGTDNKTPDEHYFYDRQGQAGPLPLYHFMQRYIPSYYNELRAFIDCVKNDTSPPVGAKEGIISLAIAVAANLSMTENRPVKMEEIIDLKSL